MEGDFQSGKSINTKMKKTNQVRKNCVILRFWPTLEDMKRDLFIDLEKQEVTSLRNGRKMTPHLNCRELKLPIEKRHYHISYKRVKLSLHRLFFYWHNGFLPRLVDHKDTNPQNNEIENLRELTTSQNTRNSHKIKKKTSSKYKGVCWNKQNKKWQANLTINYKMIFLGYFDNEDDAGQAYNNKIRQLGLEEVSILNDTPQERARMSSLFNEPEPILNLK